MLGWTEGTGPWCIRCDEPGKLQTPEHLIEDCEALGGLRLEMFGEVYPVVADLRVAQLLRFLHRANVQWRPADEV